MLFWRSLLYVPANNQRFLAKAGARGADAVILDLEDSVPPAEKAAARAGLAAAVPLVGSGGSDVLVRINRPLAEAVRDLEAAVPLGVAAVLCPKLIGPDHVRLLAEAIAALEVEPGRTRIVAMIESAAALLRAYEIAAASPRVAALMLGSEDFATALGMAPTPETLLGPKQQIVIAAAAAGVAPLGLIGTVADYQDPEAVAALARRSRAFGYQGATCIHPSVVPILNAAFAPSAEEVAAAERLIAADREAAAAGKGAFNLDGRMVDRPVVERAERLLARARDVAARR